ncbi:1,4-dihydroxy-2-naphthoate octaprenyltransferase [Weeksella virosa]|uniref:1,4-dihydroxy-2-naphthoate octaprenyltransferase n=1 Tax=Weeksella virosa TaxID=1014 RepID=UPI00255775FC|nr:1,4-dihydroxy-2-naphthoate octaprenyltransferase [Weeksella virosa]MDK7675838.1 1,4-dihydroxy-2-naphthoate octaprenyltransferase [Weeksella virosa]
MKKWIHAARLRTLPLSLSGLILAGFIAKFEGVYQTNIFFLSLFTAFCFQVLSNYANDYGDAARGTDTHRIGEKRVVASGEVTPKQMKLAILIMSIVSLFSVLALLYIAFVPLHWNYFILFLGLGIASILAAMLYTMGKKPYGYIGLGDVFVFIFFGLVAVLGGEFLYSKTFQWINILPAAAIGFWSVAVLNMNNMRDVENDVRNNKITIASKLGIRKAKIYQIILMNIPFFLALAYVLQVKPGKLSGIVFMIVFFMATQIRRKIMTVEDPKDFDNFLKPIAMMALIFSLLLGYSLIGFDFIDALTR